MVDYFLPVFFKYLPMLLFDFCFSLLYNLIKVDIVSFRIEYYSGKKKYSETFVININQDHGIVPAKQSSTNELREISNGIQELIKRIN